MDYYICGDTADKRFWGIEDCDAVVLLGYHAMAGTLGAVLEHTWSSKNIQNVLMASNYDVVSLAGNLLIYTTPSFEALTYVSERAENDGWEKSTVKELSAYILSKEPGIRGYSAQNIWRMKQFFETYKDKPELSTLLRENSWSNNMHIVSKTKSHEEKEF